MIHIIKHNKWVIAASLICVLLGVLTFLAFINESFIQLSDFNLQILLLIDLALLILFFTSIFWKIITILKDRRKGKLGSETSLRYIIFFATTTLLPSVLIAVFSLFLFNVVIQKYFEKKIKSVVNYSAEIATNYVDQTKNSIEADILLMGIDVNRNSDLFYDNPQNFQKILASQRLLRKLDEVHLLDGAGNIIMSNIINLSINYL